MRPGEKPPWTKRAQPFVGSVLLIMGLVTAGLVVRRGLDTKSLTQLGPGGMMVAGGIGLVFRAPTRRPRALAFALASVSVVAVILGLTR